MKRYVFFSLLILTIVGCSVRDKKDIDNRFKVLKEVDYSMFANTEIIDRYGIYIVTYKNSRYKIKKNTFSNKISSIEIANSINDSSVSLTKRDINYLEQALETFEDLGIRALSVDKDGTIIISQPWYKTVHTAFFAYRHLVLLRKLIRLITKNIVKTGFFIRNAQNS